MHYQCLESILYGYKIDEDFLRWKRLYSINAYCALYKFISINVTDVVALINLDSFFFLWNFGIFELLLSIIIENILIFISKHVFPARILFPVSIIQFYIVLLTYINDDGAK